MRRRRGLMWGMLWICFTMLVNSSCGSSSSSSYLTPFSSDGNRYDAGAWSPDGRWLAVEGSDRTVIALFSASGQSITYLHLECELGAGEEDFAWLPDGRISCYRAGNASVLRLFTLNRSGQSIHENMIPVPVAPHAFIYGLQWNPRHFWLAVLAESTPGTTTPTVYVSDLAGHRLLAPFALDGAHEMTWSPDGRTLAVVEQNGDVVLLTLQQEATGTLAVTRTRTLAVDTAPYERVLWSPSGRWLLCHHGTYTGEDYLFLLASDGSGKQVKLTSSTTDGQVGAVAWSPDGQQLIVARASDGALMSLDIAKLLKAKGVKP